MRGPRTAIVTGVVGLVLLVAGWGLAGVGAAGPTSPVTRAAIRWPAIPPPPDPLLRQLRQYLAHSPQASVPFRFPIKGAVLRAPHLPRPNVHGSTCFVAGGFCSITPCVVPVATAPAPGCPAHAAPWRTVAVSDPEAPVRAATFRHPSP